MFAEVGNSIILSPHTPVNMVNSCYGGRSDIRNIHRHYLSCQTAVMYHALGYTTSLSLYFNLPSWWDNTRRRRCCLLAGLAVLTISTINSSLLGLHSAVGSPHGPPGAILPWELLSYCITHHTRVAQVLSYVIHVWHRSCHTSYTYCTGLVIRHRRVA